MRAALSAIALSVIALSAIAMSATVAHAEDMLPATHSGIMCRDERSLAEFTAPNGSVKPSVMATPFSDKSKRFMAACKDAAGPVHVVTKRHNTSVVTYSGETWYVPNVDYVTATPDCLKDGAQVTLTGRIESAFAHDDENDPKKGHSYPRLTLDQPVCYLGNYAERAGRLVSLPATSSAGFVALMRMVGHHVTVHGVLTSPDNGNQPPDNMMMFDPVVRPAP